MDIAEIAKTAAGFVGGHTAETDPKPAAAKAPAEAKPQTQAIPIAVDIGWTMALLFRQQAPGFTDATHDAEERLPTEHELPAADRKALEEARLKTLLDKLGKLLDSSSAVPVVDAAALPKANVDILTWLASAGREYGIAYQLGRSIRDTAVPPLRESADVSAEQAKLNALLKQLSRSRVATLQEWLTTLEPYLPADCAAIVSASIGRWSDLVSTIFISTTPGKLRMFGSPPPLTVAGQLTDSLLPQGDAWINLLVGAESADGLLTPEGLVAAGEAALGRTARIIRKIAWHYWFVLLVLIVAVGVAVYFAARDLGGASKIWTQIAAVAGGLGITVKGTSNTMSRLSTDAEKPIFGAAKTDAMAWAVTTFPDQLKLSVGGVRALRRNGIPASAPMGRA